MAAPASGNGFEGDMYLNSDNGEVYQKIAGQWHFKAALGDIPWIQADSNTMVTTSLQRSQTP